MAETDTKDKYRPEADQRWGREIGRDQEPVQIQVRTQWLYSEEEKAGRRGDECACCPGLHAFSRAGVVTSSEARTTFDDIPGHVWAAIREFGDDADIIIEVRRA